MWWRREYDTAGFTHAHARAHIWSDAPVGPHLSCSGTRGGSLGSSAACLAALSLSARLGSARLGSALASSAVPLWQRAQPWGAPGPGLRRYAAGHERGRSAALGTEDPGVGGWPQRRRDRGLLSTLTSMIGREKTLGRGKTTNDTNQKTPRTFWSSSTLAPFLWNGHAKYIHGPYVYSICTDINVDKSFSQQPTSLHVFEHLKTFCYTESDEVLEPGCNRLTASGIILFSFHNTLKHACQTVVWFYFGRKALVPRRIRQHSPYNYSMGPM